MSKKFKGKPCTYCSDGTATTGDHVFAREFFEPSVRNGLVLPKVPSCGPCNSKKSELEHYLTTFLPFGGRHAAAETNLRDMVPKRLERNAKFRQIVQDTGIIWSAEDALGIRLRTMPLDPKQVLKWVEYILKGLAFYHWGVYLNQDVEIGVEPLTDEGRTEMDRLLYGTVARFVQNDIGNGTFMYEGAQGVDSAQVTVWRIETYGGLQFRDSKTGAVSSNLYAWSHLRKSTDK